MMITRDVERDCYFIGSFYFLVAYPEKGTPLYFFNDGEVISVGRSFDVGNQTSILKAGPDLCLWLNYFIGSNQWQQLIKFHVYGAWWSVIVVLAARQVINCVAGLFRFRLYLEKLLKVQGSNHVDYYNWIFIWYLIIF